MDTQTDIQTDTQHYDTHNDNLTYDTINRHSYSDKIMWRTFKELTNNCKQQPPRLILIGNQLTTSIKKHM